MRERTATHLYISFCSQSARLQEGFTVIHTASVHVHSCGIEYNDQQQSRCALMNKDVLLYHYIIHPTNVCQILLLEYPRAHKDIIHPYKRCMHHLKLKAIYRNLANKLLSHILHILVQLESSVFKICPGNPNIPCKQMSMTIGITYSYAYPNWSLAILLTKDSGKG